MDVEKLVKQCTICLQNKLDNQPYAGLLQPLPIPTQVWKEVSLDFIEGLPKSKDKNSILVVVDRLTKYVYFIPLTPSYMAVEVAKAFFDIIYRLHGLSEKIVFD